MGLHDLILGPLYFFITFFIAYKFKNKLAVGEIEQKLFLRVFLFKAFAVTFFALIYQFYYGGGDTFGFFNWSKSGALFFLKEPIKWFQFMFFENDELFYHFRYSYPTPPYNYLLKLGSRETFFIKFITPFTILSMGSYLALSFVFSFVVFIANWLLYKTFAYAYPDYKRGLIYSVTFIPSVGFWGSGILKDSLAFAGICIVVFSIHRLFIEKKNRLLSLLFFLFFSYIIFNIRSFTIISLLPAVMLWLFLHFNKKIKQKVLRTLLTPMVILIAVLSIGGLLYSISDSLGRFSIENMEQTIQDFQGWHEVASDGGAGYTLTVDNSSVFAMLKSFPAAVNVTYFRPYLWEVSGIVVLISAVESFFILMFFLYAFFIKAKVVKFFSLIFSEPLLMLCLVFALLYGFSVGFTSFNFGALSRYKVPGMPMFATLIYLTAALSSRKKV